MPKSWIRSRYTGNSCTSSRLRNVASDVTGPGVTTWRLVRMSPRSASTTKPVACAEVFHSVSKARVESILIATTPWAMRSRVARQVASSRSGATGSTSGASGVMPGGTPPMGTDCAPAAADAQRSIPARIRRHTAVIVTMPPMREQLENQHQQPGHAQQAEGKQHCRGAHVLGQARELMVLQADAVHCGLDRTVEQLHHQDQHHGPDQQCALDTRASQPDSSQDDRHRHHEFLPEGRLVAESPAEPPKAGPEREEETLQSTGLGSSHLRPV